MKLVDDWKRIARKAWSFRLALLTSALSAAEFIVPLLPDSAAEFIGRGKFAACAFLVSLGAGIARLVYQPKMRKP